uniref:Uncharacterized protein n=1 Tax=Rhizophora mucronata TaxID=61149 RepID=A0A2P2QI24_RHIMU
MLTYWLGSLVQYVAFRKAFHMTIKIVCREKERLQPI